MARPKKDIESLKAIKLNLRFTVNEYLIVCNNAGTLGISVADYLRKKATGKTLPRTKISPDSRKLFIELSRIGNNLNQITKKAHLGGFNSENLNLQLKSLKETLVEIKRITIQK